MKPHSSHRNVKPKDQVVRTLQGRSLLDVGPLKPEIISGIFDRTRLLRQKLSKSFRSSLPIKGTRKTIVLAFFEPSTRTRLSFGVAGSKLGWTVLLPELGLSSSIAKGESLIDTFFNIRAMDPDLIVIRHGQDLDLERAVSQASELGVPIVSGGTGTRSHPTQALLDAFTIADLKGPLDEQKVLLVGDILHSRVACSNILLLSQMGAEVGLCGPAPWLPPPSFFHDLGGPNLQYFSLEKGLKWASVVMALRVQVERHWEGLDHRYPEAYHFRPDEYHSEFGITSKRMKLVRDGILLHPGPVLRNVEIASEVLSLPQCKILEQVKNGVYLRAALLQLILS